MTKGPHSRTFVLLPYEFLRAVLPSATFAEDQIPHAVPEP